VYRVLADSGCTVCAVSTQTFTITVTAPSYVLARVTANPASGSVGAPLPVTVRLEQGGAPVPAATIQWTSTAPFAPAASTSATNAAGEASASFTPASSGSFTNAIAAQFDPDGIAANGDEVSVAFGANIGLVASLANTGGNNQSAPLNAAFAAPLQVNARNGGAPAAGVTITWTVTSGAATLAAPTSVTDAAGNAAIAITAGPTAGPVTVTASRQDDPSATVGYTLSVGALGSLGIVSGNGQQLTVGAPSAPLRVELKGAGGLPVAGAVVAWSTSTGTLASATSSTDAAGIASNTVTASAAGAVQVTASSALAAAPAVFSLNGALASLPGLTATQRSVADAIDQLCPALAALPAPTSPEQDLLLRCKELNTAAAIDPQATVTALDQLMANVALTQVNAAFSAAQSQFQNLKTRIAALRSGTGGTGFGGLAINTANGPVSLETLATAFANSADPVEVGGDFSRWGFFAAGNIGRGDADAGASSPAYDYDVDGVTAGVDYRKNDRWILGGSLGYTRQDTELPGDVGGLETRGWSVSAYSTYYQADSWYMDSVVTWGSNDYELLRQISYTLPVAGGGSTSINQVAKADSGGDLLSTAFTFGRDFNRGALGIGPYGRLLYTRLTFDDINEALLPGLPGNGLGLRIDNRDVSSLASVLGSKLTYTHSVSWGVLMPHLQLEWEHEFRDDPRAIEARFINDPTGSAMLVSGDPLDTDYFRLGLGLSMVLASGRSGFFYYEQLVGRNGMSQWNLAVGLRLEF
nr:autotransporter domain-containing protein [Arenimonas sp.]